MIRLNFALHGLASLSRGRFPALWRDRTGRSSPRRRPLRMRRYVQSPTVEDPLYDGLRTARTGMHEPFDGIAASGSIRARTWSPR